MEVQDSQEDAFYRIPLLLVLDALIEKSFHPFIPVQDMVALPVIIVCIFFFLIMTTLRNVTLKAIYLTLFSIACVRLTYDFFSTQIQNSESMKKNVENRESLSFISSILDWMRLCFVQVCAGYVLMASYLSNPILESNFSPKLFMFVFLPPLLLSNSFGPVSTLLYYVTIPFIPLFIVIWKNAPDLFDRVKTMHHLSAVHGHIDFLIEYLFFNINLKLIRRMLIYYWMLNQVASTLAVFFHIGQPEFENDDVIKPSHDVTSLNSTSSLAGNISQSEAGSVYDHVMSELARNWVLNCTKTWVVVASASALLTRLGLVLDRGLIFLLETRNPDEDFPTYCALLYMITSLQSSQ